MKAVPQIGKLIQNIHLQEIDSVNEPPTNGPRAPAIAQMNSMSPKNRLRSLDQVLVPDVLQGHDRVDNT